MSKYHKIKWRDSDNQELAKVVRNFNAKINRLAKKNPQMKNALPEKISVRELKELIKTRQDLKREMNSLRRFSKRGSEELVTVPNSDYNLQVTKWQKVEMNRRVGIINRRRAKRLEEMENIELKSRGKSLGYTKGQLGMGRAERVALSPMNAFYRTMNRKDLIKRFKAILKESQSSYFTEADLRLKENFIKGLEDSYNKNDVKEVVQAIRKMDIKDFLNTFYTEDSPFEFVYPPTDEQYHGFLNQLKSIWIPNKE